jgi:heme exporter protein CcmD
MLLDLGRHGGYILASYAAFVVVIGGLVVASVLSNRRARAELAKLDRAGDDGR